MHVRLCWQRNVPSIKAVRQFFNTPPAWRSVQIVRLRNSAFYRLDLSIPISIYSDGSGPFLGWGRLRKIVFMPSLHAMRKIDHEQRNTAVYTFRLNHIRFDWFPMRTYSSKDCVCMYLSLIFTTSTGQPPNWSHIIKQSCMILCFLKKMCFLNKPLSNKLQNNRWCIVFVQFPIRELLIVPPAHCFYL